MLPAFYRNLSHSRVVNRLEVTCWYYRLRFPCFGGTSSGCTVQVDPAFGSQEVSHSSHTRPRLDQLIGNDRQLRSAGFAIDGGDSATRTEWWSRQEKLQSDGDVSTTGAGARR